VADPYSPLFDESPFDAPFDPAKPTLQPPPRVLRQALAPRPAPPQDAGDEYRKKALELLTQAQGTQPGDADLGSMREYARKRDEQSKRDFDRGMIMQVMGGSAFQPVGAQVLKQALASQGPEKIGGGIVSDGQFFNDPEVVAQRRSTRLEQQAKIYESMAANASTLAQRDAAAQQAAETRRMIAGIAAGSRQGQQDQMRAQRSFQQENALRDDFEKQVKDQRISLGTYPQIEAALTGPPTAASDMRAIFRYMKMLDPTSVVREGEYATARNATGVPSQIANLYNKVLTGVVLTPAQRVDFLKQAKSERDTALNYFNERANEFKTRARTYGLDPENVVLGYGASGGGGDQAQQSGRGSRQSPLTVTPSGTTKVDF
jgi:hypothetical protein